MSERAKVRVVFKRDEHDKNMIKMLTAVGKGWLLHAVLFEDFFPDNLKKRLEAGEEVACSVTEEV